MRTYLLIAVLLLFLPGCAGLMALMAGNPEGATERERTHIAYIVAQELAKRAPDNPLSIPGWAYATLAALGVGGGELTRRAVKRRRQNGTPVRNPAPPA